MYSTSRRPQSVLDLNKATEVETLPYEDGTLGLYNVIVPRGPDYGDKIARNERLKLETLRDSVERVIGSLSPDSFIAGGALTSLISNEPVNDIDVFGTASNRLKSILADLGYQPTFENEFIANYQIPELSYTSKLQIIKNPITLEQYFDQLDNVANGITIGSRNSTHVMDSLIYDKSAITLARKRIIRMNQFKYPRQNLSRSLKYISRGWKIEVDTLAQLTISAAASIDSKLTVRELADSPYSFGKTKRLKPTLELFSLVSEHG